MAPGQNKEISSKKSSSSSTKLNSTNKLAKKRNSELEYLNLQNPPSKERQEIISDQISDNIEGEQVKGCPSSTTQKQQAPASASASKGNRPILKQVVTSGFEQVNNATESEINSGPSNNDEVFGGNVNADDDDEDDDDDGLTEAQRCDSRRQLNLGNESGSDSMKGKLTRNLVFAVAASTIGSSFQHGYNGGVMNAPEKVIGQFINDTYHKRWQEVASSGQIDLIYATIVSVFCIGGFFGALLTSLVADRLGRKDGLLYNNLLVLVACPLMASAEPLGSYELLIVGRLLIGMNAGLNAGLAPLYLNEIAPINLRGALGTIYQLVITLSIFLSNLLGTPQLLGSTKHWPLLFAVPLIPAALMMTALPHCKESPKYLLLECGRELQAQQALAWFRQTADLQAEMDDLRSEKERSKMAPPVSFSEMLRRPDLRRPLTIAVVIMLSQQFSGINAVLFFSTSIFRSAGLLEASAIKATLGMSLVNVLMTIISLLLVDRAGRRTLHMTGLMGMAITCLILALCLGGPSSTVGPGASSSTSSVIAVIAVYVFIAMFASGPGSIPWFLIAELFPSEARALASGLAVACNWLANFIVSLCFLPLIGLLHGYVFFLFATLLLLFYTFTYYKVPETKGATAEEISALFKRN